MKKTAFAFIVVLFIVSACNSPKQKEMASTADTEPIDLVQRGEYLVASIGCNDCHSPKIMTPTGPAPDPNRLLSGHPSDEILPPYDAETAKSYVLFNMNLTAAIGPWGTSYAANLTPDETGIGNWSEAQFLKAIKTGQWKGLPDTRQLLPPMPWQQYAHLPDGDVRAIYAYLNSIAPVNNVVPLALLSAQGAPAGK